MTIKNRSTVSGQVKTVLVSTENGAADYEFKTIAATEEALRKMSSVFVITDILVHQPFQMSVNGPNCSSSTGNKTPCMIRWNCFRKPETVRCITWGRLSTLALAFATLF
jgi:hypothetical protein